MCDVIYTGVYFSGWHYFCKVEKPVCVHVSIKKFLYSWLSCTLIDNKYDERFMQFQITSLQISLRYSRM